jgi:glycosyltransferase involved in cell wall biosynthesis
VKIGIDISLLQTAHRRRGIGYTLINFINHLPEDAKKEHQFVLYHYEIEPDNDPFELLNLESVKYEARVIKLRKLYDTGNRGRTGIAMGISNQLKVLRDILLGDSRIKELKDLNHFLQFDQSQPLPSRSKVTSSLIVYDLIPYVMEADYLWSYKTARSHGRSRKNSFKHEAVRKVYKLKNQLITREAKHLIAISEHTKKDFVKYLGVNSKKIKVCLLGVDEVRSNNTSCEPFNRYRQTSWGPVSQKIDLSDKMFLLFIGGADPRRRLTDLLAAFNNLRAGGHEIKLVLAGDTMQGTDTTPVEELKKYFKNTSYINDIYFLGFVTDSQREWLYKNALAFVYPSLYEGFGLPILEAMRYGTPVITYENSSIVEVGGNAPIYSSGYKGIIDAVTKLYDPSSRSNLNGLGISQAKKFSWDKTSSRILEHLK